ncbi:hypothetical protein KI387_009628, partial [Taxus chinensis]
GLPPDTLTLRSIMRDTVVVAEESPILLNLMHQEVQAGHGETMEELENWVREKKVIAIYRLTSLLEEAMEYGNEEIPMTSPDLDCSLATTPNPSNVPNSGLIEPMSRPSNEAKTNK